MASTLSNLPPMFHRRLLLVLAAMLVVFGVLSLQLFRLSLVEGAERRASAAEKLKQRTLLATVRGDILDREGRQLAVDRASYELAVHYDLVTGAWAFKEAARAAAREAGRSVWNQMGPEERDAAIAAVRPDFEDAARRIWDEIAQLGQVSPEDLMRRRDAIRRRVMIMAATVWASQEEQWQQDREERAQVRFGTIDDDARFSPSPIREQRQTHMILPGISDEMAFDFERLAQRHPGLVEVKDSLRREYPWLACDVVIDRRSLPRALRSDEPLTVLVEGVADHVIGSMRDEVWRRDIERRPYKRPDRAEPDLGGYLPGDRVGARGLEEVFEDELRGMRGENVRWMDTGRFERREPQRGRDIRLTIDIALQARVQAVLSHELGLTRVQPWHHNALPEGTALNSAAVVIHVPSGDIMAMASMPTLAMGRRLDAERRQRDQPGYFRPTEAVYPPGSILKPLVLCTAVEAGVHDLESPIECTGHFFPNLTLAARCWIYREDYGFATHAPLRASEAIGRSCNIFFYTLADRLGMPALVEGLQAFGLGHPVGTALRFEELFHDEKRNVFDTRWIGEVSGYLPDADDIEVLRDAGQLKFATVVMGIGQGRLTWTPLQAANAYAMLARGGVVRDARLVLDGPEPEREQRADFDLSPDLVAAALEGLRQSVEEQHGTGYKIPYGPSDYEVIFTAPEVSVWGKTGTAQAPPWFQDKNGDGEVQKDELIRDLDHSWFVVLVGPEGSPDPLFAIAVIVEYGGSGGRASGPIVDQVIRALQVEGYLPGSDA